MIPSLYQIFLALLAFLFAINACLKFFRRENKQTFFKLALALLVWGTVIVFSLFPPIVRTLSEYLGLGSNLNTLIFIGFVIVFFILFRILSLIEQTEQTISALVRKEALRELRKDKQ